MNPLAVDESAKAFHSAIVRIDNELHERAQSRVCLESWTAHLDDHTIRFECAHHGIGVLDKIANDASPRKEELHKRKQAE